MSLNVGILVFDGVDELDFVGPLDVFSYALGWGKDGRVVTVGRELNAMRGVNGLKFVPECEISDAPTLDVVVVPGGHGATEAAKDAAILEWVDRAAQSARWVCSVCTGCFILQAAGLTDGHEITTHSGMLDELRSAKRGHVVAGQRYVIDGNLVSSAGVSAGIDMSLWVVGQLFGEDHAKFVRAALEYEPQPPF